MCEKILLEKIQGLENQIEFTTMKKKEITKQKETKNKHGAKMTKWKVLALEHLAKSILYDQML
jgi:hypothetical protein